MSLIRDGEYHILSDGWIKIDRRDYAVGQGRIPKGRMLLGLNQHLLFKGGKYLLIDTGLGDKWRREELGLLGYQLPRRLRTELAMHDVDPQQIDIVLFTHLHYDHSGGGTRRTGDLVAPSFPNAVYYVNEIELRTASNPAPDKMADYRREDFIPLLERGLLKSVSGEFEVVPGVSLHPAPGHSPGHQVVKIELEDETLLFAGDLISTRSHANLQITMVYDDDRETLIHHRRRWIDSASTGNWKVIFCHAVRNPIGSINP